MLPLSDLLLRKDMLLGDVFELVLFGEFIDEGCVGLLQQVLDL
jgi:hypothetical protein